MPKITAATSVNITGECLDPYRMDFSEFSNIMTTFILVTVKHFGEREENGKVVNHTPKSTDNVP